MTPNKCCKATVVVRKPWNPPLLSPTPLPLSQAARMFGSATTTRAFELWREVLDAQLQVAVTTKSSQPY